MHKNKLSLLDHTFNSTINTFELSQDDFHSAHSYKMAKIVSRTNTASKAIRDKAREELLKNFSTFYINKTLQSLEGMHIFDKHGKSLLRFQKINKNDDDIINLRESLQKISKDFKYQKGLEVGLCKESYRFQYPLFYDGEFVGSYEYSVSFDAIQREMKKFFSQQYVLLLDAYRVDSIIFDAAKIKRYTKLLVGKKEYYFDEMLFNSKEKVKHFKNILQSDNVEKIIDSNSWGVVDFFVDNNRYDIIIKPVSDISSKDLGFIVAIAKNDYLSDIEERFFMDLFLATLLSLSIFVFVVRQVKNRNYVRELINTQKDMLIVTNTTGIQDANDTMLEFFGYKTLNAFHKEHDCICDFFIKGDGFLEAEVDGMYWVEYILQNQNKGHKVKIKDPLTSMNRIFDLDFTVLKSTNSVFIVFRDITQEYMKNKRLKDRANYDSLTKIYNRSSFEYYLDQEIKNSYKNDYIFSLIMFDIDHFKKINDTYGHDVGDTILKELTQLVESHIRQSDILARWGGEEFMIISKAKLEHSETLAEKIRHIVESYNFKEVGRVTCSFGVTQFHDQDTKESIMKRVDNMLYSAKENGRNTVVSIR